MIGVTNLKKVKENCEKFWKQEFIGRPFAAVTCVKDGAIVPNYDSSYVLRSDKIKSGDFDSSVQEYKNYIQNFVHYGEAMPFFACDFGPDQYAAFYGGEIVGQKGQYTTWVHKIAEYAENLNCNFDKNNKTFQLFLKYFEHVRKVAGNDFLIGTPDLHSNLDTLSALLDPQNLCVELMDNPDIISEKLNQLNDGYATIYDAVFAAINGKNLGTIGWQPIWSPKKSAVVQCDFSCMISPAMARKYVIPSIEREVAHLDHSVYHYDGKGALGHVDDILSIKKLNCVQWVPGDGEKRTIYWMDLLKKIQKAGKSVWIYDWTPEEILNDKELIPEKTFFSLGCSSQKEAEEFLKKLERKYK